MRRSLLFAALGLGCLLCAPLQVAAQGTTDTSASGALNGHNGSGVNWQTDPTLFGDPVSRRHPAITITGPAEFLSGVRARGIQINVTGPSGNPSSPPKKKLHTTRAIRHRADQTAA